MTRDPQPVIDVQMVTDVARALSGSRLPLDRDPTARIEQARVDAADPHRVRFTWTLFGEPHEYDVRITEGVFQPDVESIVRLIHWDIVEDVKTGEIR